MLTAKQREFRVALTVDAEHPSRAWHDSSAAGDLLDALAAEGVLATFFVQGRWARSEPRVVQRIVDAGHLVANHSHHHARLTMLSTRGITADAELAAAALAEVAGVDGRPWFRCPFGDGGDNARVQSALATAGYRHVGWDVDSLDWAAPTDPGSLADRVVAAVEAVGDGCIVLLHSWPAVTPVALPTIVQRLRGRGARFVPAADLVPDDHRGAAPKEDRWQASSSIG